MLIIAPYKISMGVKKVKNYTIGLNGYRNWHYQVSNNLKIRYKELIFREIKKLKPLYMPVITYTMYYPDKRLRDKSNFCCIHEKFFCDSLVELGKLKDDNDLHLGDSIYRYGGIDKENPRCEIFISE